MASQELKRIAHEIYTKKLSEANGINSSDRAFFAMQRCNSKTDGTGICPIFGVVCGRVDEKNCSVVGFNLQVKKLHGNGEDGELNKRL